MALSSLNEHTVSSLPTSSFGPKSQTLEKTRLETENSSDYPTDSLDLSFSENPSQVSRGELTETESSQPLAFSENNFFKLQLQNQGHSSGALKNLYHHAGFRNNVGSTLNISH